jgi:hypothetical protein
MRKRPLLLGCVAFFAAIALMVAWLRSGVRPRPGKVDPSTPFIQKSFTLLQVSEIARDGRCAYEELVRMSFVQRLIERFRGRNVLPRALASTYVEDHYRGGLGLWIKPAWLPKNAPLMATMFSRTQRAFAASGTSSTGEKVPLPASLHQGLNVQWYVLVVIPGGYPDTFKWMDISLKDKAGNTARWRVDGLPPSHHAIPPPVQVQESAKVAQWTIRARAWRTRNANMPGREDAIGYEMKADGQPGPNQWEITRSDATTEWEPATAPGGSGTATSSLGNPGARFGSEEVVNYPRSQRYIQLRGEVRQFDAYDEKVTFRGLTVKASQNKNYLLVVNKPITETTPSGVSVTLPTQNNAPGQPAPTGGMSEGLSFSVVLPASGDAKSLPRSPMVARHQGPIGIRIQGFDPPFAERGWSHSVSGGVHEVSVGMPKPPPKGPIDLTVIIRQRVDLQAISYTLTLPVVDKKAETPEWR